MEREGSDVFAWKKREKMVWLGRVAEQLGGVLGRRSGTGSSGLDCLSETEGKGNIFQKNAGCWQRRELSDTGEEVCLEERKAESGGRGQPHARHPTWPPCCHLLCELEANTSSLLLQPARSRATGLKAHVAVLKKRSDFGDS